MGAGTHRKSEGLQPSQPQAVRGMQQACHKHVWGTHALIACAGLSSLQIFGLHLTSPLTDKRTGGQGWGGPPRGAMSLASLGPTSFPASAFSPHLRGPPRAGQQQPVNLGLKFSQQAPKEPVRAQQAVTA